MKRPTGPFWAWNDIGCGLKWHLCTVNGGSNNEPAMMSYLLEEFEDYWDEEDWSDAEIVPIKAPEPLE